MLYLKKNLTPAEGIFSKLYSLKANRTQNLFVQLHLKIYKLINKMIIKSKILPNRT